MKCQGDHDVFRFADPETERDAEKSLTEDARQKLQIWLQDVHDHAMLQTKSKVLHKNTDIPESADDAEDNQDELDELDAKPVAAALPEPVAAELGPHAHIQQKPEKK